MIPDRLIYFKNLFIYVLSIVIWHQVFDFGTACWKPESVLKLYAIWLPLFFVFLLFGVALVIDLWWIEMFVDILLIYYRLRFSAIAANNEQAAARAAAINADSGAPTMYCLLTWSRYCHWMLIVLKYVLSSKSIITSKHGNASKSMNIKRFNTSLLHGITLSLLKPK